MRRKFYANMEGSHKCSSIAPDPCPKCGGRVVQDARFHPAPYLIEPPYKRTPIEYQSRTEILSHSCMNPECNWSRNDEQLEIDRMKAMLRVARERRV